MSRRTKPSPSLFSAAALAVTLAAHPCLAGGTGQPDTENRYPNVAAIVVTGLPGAPYIAGSGVLIHPRVLLTAGHVTIGAEELVNQGVPLSDIGSISFGPDAFDPSTWVEAVAVLTFPGFAIEPDAISQDVGVVILKEPADLPCATLGFEGLLDELKDAGVLGGRGDPVKFTSVGYGATLEFPPPDEVPPDGLRRVSSPEYRALENVWLIMNQDPAAGNSGMAAGDSGGPVFWRAADGGLVVVALNSRTDRKRVSLYKAYRVDTAEALGFIDFVLALVDGGWL